LRKHVFSLLSLLLPWLLSCSVYFTCSIPAASSCLAIVFTQCFCHCE
jgi:hypothetical protein